MRGGRLGKKKGRREERNYGSEGREAWREGKKKGGMVGGRKVGTKERKKQVGKGGMIEARKEGRWE